MRLTARVKPGSSPPFLPVSIADMDAHLGLDMAYMDSLGQSQLTSILTRFIYTAADYIEQMADLTLYQREYHAYGDAFPCSDFEIMQLPRAFPLIQVNFVKFTDSSGVQINWPNYTVDYGSHPGGVFPLRSGGYPTEMLSFGSPVQVEYVAGNTVSPFNQIGELAKSAVCLMAAGLFENRESETLVKPGKWTEMLDTIGSKYGVKSMINILREGNYGTF